MIIACLAAAAIDGDSIRCSNLGQVRLLGMSAARKHKRRELDFTYQLFRCDQPVFAIQPVAQASSNSAR